MERFKITITTGDALGNVRDDEEYTIIENAHDHTNVHAALTALRNFEKQNLTHFPHSSNELTIVVKPFPFER